MTPADLRREAEARMAAAKERFTAAARAALAANPDASSLAFEACRQVNAARAELRALEEPQTAACHEMETAT